MFLLGFFSPKHNDKEKEELSVHIFNWLKTNTSFTIHVVSHTDEFFTLPSKKQSFSLKKLEKQTDILILDFPHEVTEQTCFLFNAVDKLYVLGEEHLKLTESIYTMLDFYSPFQKKKHEDITLLPDKAFVLQKERIQAGFNPSQKELTYLAESILNEYSIHKINKIHENNFEQLIKKIQKLDKSKLYLELHTLGFDFNKSLLLQKYLYVREAYGQSFENALEELLPSFIQDEYVEVLKQFQDELYLMQVSFGSEAEEEEDEEGNEEGHPEE